jgi:hypothetical protein
MNLTARFARLTQLFIGPRVNHAFSIASNSRAGALSADANVSQGAMLMEHSVAHAPSKQVSITVQSRTDCASRYLTNLTHTF